MLADHRGKLARHTSGRGHQQIGFVLGEDTARGT